MSKDARSSADVQSIRLRVPQPTKELIERAAARWGMSLSAFIIEAASRAAEQALDPSRTTYLPPEAFAALLDALDRPPTPIEGLRAAFERHRRVIDSNGDTSPSSDERK